MSKALRIFQSLFALAMIFVVSGRSQELFTFQKVGAWPKFDHGAFVAIAIDRGRLYAAAERGGLIIAEMSNPLAPTIIGGTSTDAWAWGIAADRDIAYVRTEGGLRCFDTVDAASPRLIFSDTNTVRGVVARDGFAFVAANSMLEIFDGRDGTPAPVATFPTPAAANGVALSANVAYWLKAAENLPNIDGVMYTTWVSNFSDLEKFAETARLH